MKVLVNFIGSKKFQRSDTYLEQIDIPDNYDGGITEFVEDKLSELGYLHFNITSITDGHSNNDWPETEERIDVIGQNGNDGDHYIEEHQWIIYTDEKSNKAKFSFNPTYETKWIGIKRKIQDRAMTVKDFDNVEVNEYSWIYTACPDSTKQPHYNKHPSGIECIEVVEHMSFNLGNAIKYIWRCDLKENDIEDLNKAKYYIQREIDLRLKNENK